MSNAIALRVNDTQSVGNLKAQREKKAKLEKTYQLLDAFVSGKGKRMETSKYVEYTF